tara:strand:+ start:138 stop:290 length:153 start_codon:yes stop_codon:yes gene_type:complete
MGISSKAFSNVCAGIFFLACAGGVISGAIDGSRETRSNIRKNGRKAKANA